MCTLIEMELKPTYVHVHVISIKLKYQTYDTNRYSWSIKVKVHGTFELGGLA